jgi:hypothetical protein
MVPSWLTCVVLSGYYLARFKLAQVSVIPSDMGNTCPLQSFSSNSTFIMLYLIHEMDVDYLVVKEMVNMSKLFDYTFMFSIDCKPIIIPTQTWLNLLKVLKVNYCRLKSLSLKAFA